MRKTLYLLFIIMASLVVGLDARVLTITFCNKTDRAAYCLACSSKATFRLEPSGLGGSFHSYSVVLPDGYPFEDRIFFRPAADCKTAFDFVERTFSLPGGPESLQITYFMCFNEETGSFEIRIQSQIAPRPCGGVTE